MRHLSVDHRRRKGFRDGEGKEMLPKETAALPLFSGLTGEQLSDCHQAMDGALTAFVNGIQICLICFSKSGGG